MNTNLIIELINRGWQRGHECYYTRKGELIIYYNIEPNTFSFTNGSNSPEVYLGAGSLEVLEEIESKIINNEGGIKW
jgi:hypothetical protein